MGLKDDWGFPIRPANLTTGLFKSGPSVKDIFRTISTGLSRHADAFVRAARCRTTATAGRSPTTSLSLSAYKDPLTGKPLPMSEEDRQALDDPATVARTSSTAYVPLAERTYANGDRTAPEDGAAFAGGAWARRSGVDVLPERPVAAGVHR